MRDANETFMCRNYGDDTKKKKKNFVKVTNCVYVYRN